MNDPWRAYAGIFNANANSEIQIIGDFVPPVDVEDVLGIRINMGFQRNWRLAVA